jgi:hypothetical protein
MTLLVAHVNKRPMINKQYIGSNMQGSVLAYFKIQFIYLCGRSSDRDLKSGPPEYEVGAVNGGPSFNCLERL